MDRTGDSPKQLFRRFDTSGDGGIEKSEFQEALSILCNHNISDRDMDLIWAIFHGNSVNNEEEVPFKRWNYSLGLDSRDPKTLRRRVIAQGHKVLKDELLFRMPTPQNKLRAKKAFGAAARAFAGAAKKRQCAKLPQGSLAVASKFVLS